VDTVSVGDTGSWTSEQSAETTRPRRNKILVRRPKSTSSSQSRMKTSRSMPKVRCAPLSLFTDSSCSFFVGKQLIALAHISHCNSVCLFVCSSVTRVDQSKTVQAGMIKSSPSAARKTLVSGTVKLFHKFERGHPNLRH